ncbi:hypothetical protein [Streptomyces erythrochromogenes]|uniref:hypothetical protein n=1 Tax=Streptomyces erythrochromogenes TaxID=285574 RepID=UPI0036FD9356
MTRAEHEQAAAEELAALSGLIAAIDADTVNAFAEAAGLDPEFLQDALEGAA